MDKQKGFVAVLLMVGAIVILLIGGAYFIGVKKQSIPSIPSVTQNFSSTPSVGQKNTYPDFFLFSIPKPIKNLAVSDLPNNQNPVNVVSYNGHLWFAGDGSIVEYDTNSGKLVSYSNPKKGNCESNVVITKEFLFTSCRMNGVKDFSSEYTGKPDYAQYAIFKINPSTHEVEHIFTPKDGLVNTSNYYLYSDRDTVWVATEGGVVNINASTNQVKFYSSELGIPGSILSTRTMFVNKDYVWVAVNANVGSQGGLSMYDKKTQVWKAFNVRDLKDYSTDRFDLEAGFKSIPGGIQIAFRDGNLDTSDRLVEKQYNYQTGKWTKVNIERPASGAQSETTRQYITTTYPPFFNDQKVDQFGLTQIQLPDSSQTYQLDGRNNYVLSPMVEDKRYILTSATVDVIDDTSPFRKILVKLGERLEGDVRYADSSAFQGLVTFLIDPTSSLAVVADSYCGGMGCTGGQKAWLVDLKGSKIVKVYTAKSDNLPSGELLTGLSMAREGNTLVIKDKNGKPLFSIDTINYNLTVLNK